MIHTTSTAQPPIYEVRCILKPTLRPMGSSTGLDADRACRVAQPKCDPIEAGYSLLVAPLVTLSFHGALD